MPGASLCLRVLMIKEDNPRRPLRRQPMVGWYDPDQLLRTGLEVLISTWISRHSDSRRIDALTYKAVPLDYTGFTERHPDGSFTFDYVADTGDGWDATYSVASLVCQPTWTDGDVTLPRGRLLIFGGDQVYPYPTWSNYEDRLNRPYEVALRRWGDDPGDAVAIPGNHDWYDSLVHFRKLFCSGGRICGRQTRQRHSYFVARLPHGWWIFAADTQLDGDLDEAQADYLIGQANKVPKGDRAILCLADPGWFEAWRDADPRRGPTPAARSIPEPGGDRLQRLIVALNDALVISVASDEHCYRRDTSDDGRHLIACGIGGAFLHPTHSLPDDPKREFSHQQSYPSKETSRALTSGNLLFAIKNPRFGALAAFSYLTASWSNGLASGTCYEQTCVAELGTIGLVDWRDAFVAAFHSLLLNPVGAALYLLIFLGFIFFSDRPRTAKTLSLGVAHALVHIVAGVLIYWLATYVAVTGFSLAPKSIAQMLLSGGLIFVFAWFVGSVIFGLYLYLCLNHFGIHANEAFSALRNPDYKGFLRFRVRPGGQLDMWCIGIDRVPRRWIVTRRADGYYQVDPARGENLRGRVVDHIRIAGTGGFTPKVPSMF